MKICIDPGHAGRSIDPGAVGPTGLQEADVTLSVCERLRNILQNLEHEVVMTRESVEDQASDSLSYRAQIANSSGADIFVSVHCNSAGSAEAHGTETWIYTGSSAGRALAEKINPRMVALGLADRGIKEANFAVLRLTDMPAILIETAFISNPDEENLLRDETFLNNVAQAISDGIYDYQQG